MGLEAKDGLLTTGSDMFWVAVCMPSKRSTIRVFRLFSGLKRLPIGYAVSWQRASVARTFYVRGSLHQDHQPGIRQMSKRPCQCS